ncbi:MAG: urea carboxylase-associated family protein [Mesorhizobium sp.]|uniref:urea carboxylase-associated family protein n=1 Tax=Mesorhizobium sp. TaxID=1871066 RepID=UPI000FE5386B|nr:urea carboxylase-associated family protein [Mesorhizobium sp.]RWN42277.1 MAG: urea carboxylase-associated family protein [Mesorhizobium sp.]
MPEPRRIVVPPQSGRAIRVSRGDLIRIIDPKGQQVSDLWAFSTDPTVDWLSTSQTRDITERLFPAIGDSFFSAAARPMLTLVENASPGPHDMLYPACDSALYERAGSPNHPNCRDNLMKALASEGISLPFAPDPVDFFQNSLPQPDGRLVVDASINPPGGYVTLRAEQNLLLVVTACSVDHHPTNGGICTEIHVEITPGS